MSSMSRCKRKQNGPVPANGLPLTSRGQPRRRASKRNGMKWDQGPRSTWPEREKGSPNPGQTSRGRRGPKAAVGRGWSPTLSGKADDAGRLNTPAGRGGPRLCLRPPVDCLSPDEDNPEGGRRDKAGGGPAPRPLWVSGGRVTPTSEPGWPKAAAARRPPWARGKRMAKMKRQSGEANKEEQERNEETGAPEMGGRHLLGADMGPAASAGAVRAPRRVWAPDPSPSMQDTSHGTEPGGSPAAPSSAKGDGHRGPGFPEWACRGEAGEVPNPTVAADPKTTVGTEATEDRGERANAAVEGPATVDHLSGRRRPPGHRGPSENVGRAAELPECPPERNPARAATAVGRAPPGGGATGTPGRAGHPRPHRRRSPSPHARPQTRTRALGRAR